MIEVEWFNKKLESIKLHYPIVSMMDENGIMMYISENHKDVLGYLPDDVIGKTLAPYVNPIDEEYLMGMFSRMVMTKQPIETKSEVRHKDGHYVVIRSYSIPLYENEEYKGCVMYSMERPNETIVQFRKDRLLSEIKYAM